MVEQRVDDFALIERGVHHAEQDAPLAHTQDVELAQRGEADHDVAFHGAVARGDLHAETGIRLVGETDAGAGSRLNHHAQP